MADSDMRGIARTGDTIVIVSTLIAAGVLLATSLVPWITVTLPTGQEVTLGHEAIPDLSSEVDPQTASIIVLVCAVVGLASAALGLIMDRRFTVLAAVTGLAATVVVGYFGYRVQSTAERLRSPSNGDGSGDGGLGDIIGDLIGRVMPEISLTPGWYTALIVAIVTTLAGCVAAVVGMRTSPEPAPPPPAWPTGPGTPAHPSGPDAPAAGQDTAPQFLPPDEQQPPSTWPGERQ